MGLSHEITITKCRYQDRYNLRKT